VDFQFKLKPILFMISCLVLCLCRYHYNVNTSRLLVHVQKGWEDGLYISCVASSANLWGIVMDAGTDFVQQIYKVHYSSFLPKVGI